MKILIPMLQVQQKADVGCGWVEKQTEIAVMSQNDAGHPRGEQGVEPLGILEILSREGPWGGGREAGSGGEGRQVRAAPSLRGSPGLGGRISYVTK